MNMKTIYGVLLALALALPARLAAQDDASLYMQQAGGSALLYRGHRAYSYPSPYNGTYYWTSPLFRTGSVYFKGKHYDDLLLNIDAVRQDLLVKTISGRDDKVLNAEYVESFSMDGHRFLNLRTLYGSDAPAGYWEVLYDGKAKILKQVVRTLMQDLEGHMRSEMGYDGEYKNGVFNIFVYSAKYCYLGEDGTITPIRRRSQLMHFYKDRKREINRYISKQEASGMIPLEDYCVKVVKYAESR